MTDNVVYPATGLTGGTDHDLDGYDGNGLAENDMAIVIDDNYAYIYTLKNDGAVESSPDVITPDTNPGTLAWHMVPVYTSLIPNPLEVGVADTTRGQLYLYGHASGTDEGGEARFYLSDDHNGTITYYGVQAYEDDLQIGPDTNPDMLELKASGALSYTGGATIANMSIGINNTILGQLDLYGHGSGGDGGRLLLNSPTGATLTKWWVQSFNEDLLIGHSGDYDIILVNGSTDQVQFTNAAGIDVTGSITVGGTVDTVDIAAFKLSYDNHVHDTQTLQADGVNSDGGAFSFTTSGAVTFSNDVNTQALDVTGNITVSGTVDGIDLSADLVYNDWGVGTNNFVAGVNAGTALAAGSSENIAIGTNALDAITTQTGHIAIGHDAFTDKTGGNYSIAIGEQCAVNITNATNSIYIGYSNAFWVQTGNGVILIGSSAGQGWNGMTQNSIESVGIGQTALGSSGPGIQNVAIGQQALLGAVSNDPGRDNVGVGWQAGYLTRTPGDYNVFLGSKSGNANQTGSQNVLIGYQSGDTLLSGDGNIIIGYDVDVSAAGVSNELNIGGLIKGDISVGQVTINGTYGCDTTAYTSDTALGNADFGTSFITLNGTASCDITGWTPTVGHVYYIYAITSVANNPTVTLSAGITWEGANDTATWDAVGEGLHVICVSATRLKVISNPDGIAFS